MANVTYEREITAQLIIDPYNDFITEGGKMWDRIRAADFSDKFMHAALVTNLPNYASAIVTASEVVDSISSAKAAKTTAQ